MILVLNIATNRMSFLINLQRIKKFVKSLDYDYHQYHDRYDQYHHHRHHRDYCYYSGWTEELSKS